jgi:hypothetical protein
MILHIATSNTFTKPFFAFVKDHIGLKGHVVLSRSRRDEWPEELHLKTYHGMWFGWVIMLFYQAWKADKIILHNLSDPRIVMILFLQPWTLKKCYWIIWGSDLYAYQAGNRNWRWHFKEIFRSYVISRIGHLVTSVEGDVELARKWYRATGSYHECIVYTSNLYKISSRSTKSSGRINIQIGNSADPENNHLDLFARLKHFRDEDILIYVPLSYGGSKKYRDLVIEAGNSAFGLKFKALTELLPYRDYLELLATIDVAVFDHKRQQAMGNIVTLLGLGRKVYLKRGVTSWQLFEKLGIKVFDNSEITIDTLDSSIANLNKNRVMDYFSEENLTYQLRALFNGTC